MIQCFSPAKLRRIGCSEHGSYPDFLASFFPTGFFQQVFSDLRFNRSISVSGCLALFFFSLVPLFPLAAPSEVCLGLVLGRLSIINVFVLNALVLVV